MLHALGNQLILGVLLHGWLQFGLSRRDHDAILFVGELLQVQVVVGPAVANLAKLVYVYCLASSAHPPGENLSVPPFVLLLQHGMGAPHDAHTGAAAGLDTRHAVLEYQALLGRDGLLPRGQAVVDGLERQQVDVGQRLAPAGLDAGVVAQDAARRREDGEELRQVRRLDLEVAAVAARRQGDVDPLGLLLPGGDRLVALLQVPPARAAEVRQQLLNARERLGRGKVLLLQGAVLGHVVVVGDGQLRPLVEDLVGLGSGPALELRLDGPGQVRPVVLFEEQVDTERVDVLGVQEQAVHVEETGPHGREAIERMCVSQDMLVRYLVLQLRGRSHTLYEEPW